MVIRDDWPAFNLEGQDHLKGVRFERKAYRAYSPEWDHDHCAACWVRLAEPELGCTDAVHEGYATCDDFIRGAEYEWVCPACFEAFAERMAWIDATPDRSRPE
jgi:hypothetical protein